MLKEAMHFVSISLKNFRGRACTRVEREAARGGLCWRHRESYTQTQHADVMRVLDANAFRTAVTVVDTWQTALQPTRLRTRQGAAPVALTNVDVGAELKQLLEGDWANFVGDSPVGSLLAAVRSKIESSDDSHVRLGLLTHAETLLVVHVCNGVNLTVVVGRRCHQPARHIPHRRHYVAGNGAGRKRPRCATCAAAPARRYTIAGLRNNYCTFNTSVALQDVAQLIPLIKTNDPLVVNLTVGRRDDARTSINFGFGGQQPFKVRLLEIHVPTITNVDICVCW